MFKPKAVISRGDVDGIASAALALRRFSCLEVVLFADCQTLMGALGSLDLESCPALVLDIPPPRGLRKSYSYELVRSMDVERQLELLGGARLVFIDHHPDIFPSTSWMLHGWDFTSGYLPALGVAGEGAVSDMWRASHEVEKDASTLARALLNAGDGFRARVALGLARGKRVQQMPFVVSKAEENSRRLRSLLDFSSLCEMALWLDDETCVLAVPESYGDLRSFIGRVADAAEEKLEPETLFMFWANVVDNVSVVTMRSSRLDLTRLVERLRALDGGRAGGGGSRYAASYSSSLPMGALARLVLQVYEELK
jgi:hypothetical protein